MVIICTACDKLKETFHSNCSICIAAQRRKLQAKLSVIGLPPAPPLATGIQSTALPTGSSGGELGSVDVQEECSGGEEGEGGTQWNWRDDEK